MITGLKKRVICAALTLMLAATAAIGPASARPDELILKDAPYEAALVEDCLQPMLYRVKQGDSLWKIAHLYGTTINGLAAANDLSVDEVLAIGQVVYVPSTATHSAPGEYVVQKGDTLWDISNKFNISIVAIATTNGLSNVNQLRVGQRLTLPNGGATSYAMTTPVSFASRGGGSLDLMWPVAGEVSSFFGMRNGRPHEGLDIAANTGTPIKAARPGKVIYAGHKGTYGLAVVIDHGEGLTTLYAHCSRTLVRTGENVKGGQEIALVGSTGHSTGPHLHLEVRQNDIPYDPLLFLRVYA